MKWPEIELEKVTARIRNGLNIKQSADTKGLPITRIESISDQIINPERVGYAGIKEGEKQDWYLREGEILFSHINSEERIGNCAIYDGHPSPLVHGMNLLCFSPDTEVIEPQYLLSALRSPALKVSLKPIIKRAVNQASVSIGNLKQLRIPLPPPSEQRRIVEILDQADRLRKLRVEADKKAERILPALFIKMFGDPSTNPKGWKSAPFGTLVDIGTQLVNPNRNQYKTLPHIGGEHIESNTGQILPYETVENCNLRSNKFHFSSRHILFSKIRPYLNKVAFPQFDGLCSADIYPLLPKNDQITPWYLISLLRSQAFLDYAKVHSDRLRIPKLNKTQLGAFETPIPDSGTLVKFELQAEKIMKLGRFRGIRGEKIEKIFSVMLYRAFTGDLTASWRQSHMKELLQEMEFQAKALAS